MKTLLILTYTLTHLLTYSARAAEVSPTSDLCPPTSALYRSGEFSLDLFGAVRTRDFEHERSAGGVGVNYFFTRQIGLGLEGFSGDLNGVLVDDARVHLIYRIPIGKSAPYFFSGGGRNFESDENAISLGVGLEHRFTPRFGVFVDARMDKVLDHSAKALGRAGIRINF